MSELSREDRDVSATLDVDEAAKVCGVSPWTIHKWVQRGHLKPIRLTLLTRLRFREEDVIECAVARRSKRESERLDAMTRRWQDA